MVKHMKLGGFMARESGIVLEISMMQSVEKPMKRSNETKFTEMVQIENSQICFSYHMVNSQIIS